MALIAPEAVWEYQSASNVIPGDPSSVVPPAAGWTAGGISPFGTIGTLLPRYAINTPWASGEGLWIRRNFVTNGEEDVLVEGQVDDVAHIYINSVYFGTVNQAAVSRLADFVCIIPKSLLPAGTNLIAVRCFDVGGSDSYITLEARYSPYLMPFQPEAPIREKVRWLTDVHVSKDGTESRNQIVVSPVQEFEYVYPTTAARKSLAYNLAWTGVAKDWLVPVWSQLRFYGAIALDSEILTGVDIAYAEFRDASLVLLWEDSSTWQVIGIDRVLASSFELIGKTNAFSNAWIMPIRLGFLPDTTTRRHNGYEASFRLQYQIQDNEALSVGAPTQFNSNDIYTDENLLSGDTSDNMDAGIDIFDPGHGLSRFYPFWLNTKLARNQKVVCENQSEAWALRQFLHRRAGRYRPFYQPSFENDLRVVNTGVIGTDLRIHDDNYRTSASNRTHIAIEGPSGWLFRTILSASDFGSGITELTLDTALSIAATSVRRVCWLGLHRLNTDSVEIRYVGNNAAMSEFRLLEVLP